MSNNQPYEFNYPKDLESNITLGYYGFKRKGLGDNKVELKLHAFYWPTTKKQLVLNEAFTLTQFQPYYGIKGENNIYYTILDDVFEAKVSTDDLFYRYLVQDLSINLINGKKVHEYGSKPEIHPEEKTKKYKEYNFPSDGIDYYQDDQIKIKILGMKDVKGGVKIYLTQYKGYQFSDEPEIPFKGLLQAMGNSHTFWYSEPTKDNLERKVEFGKNTAFYQEIISKFIPPLISSAKKSESVDPIDPMQPGSSTGSSTMYFRPTKSKITVSQPIGNFIPKEKSYMHYKDKFPKKKTVFDRYAKPVLMVTMGIVVIYSIMKLFRAKEDDDYEELMKLLRAERRLNEEKKALILGKKSSLKNVVEGEELKKKGIKQLDDNKNMSENVDKVKKLIKYRKNKLLSGDKVNVKDKIKRIKERQKKGKLSKKDINYLKSELLEKKDIGRLITKDSKQPVSIPEITIGSTQPLNKVIDGGSKLLNTGIQQIGSVTKTALPEVIRSVTSLGNIPVKTLSESGKVLGKGLETIPKVLAPISSTVTGIGKELVKAPVQVVKSIKLPKFPVTDQSKKKKVVEEKKEVKQMLKLPDIIMMKKKLKKGSPQWMELDSYEKILRKRQGMSELDKLKEKKALYKKGSKEWKEIDDIQKAMEKKIFMEEEIIFDEPKKKKEDITLPTKVILKKKKPKELIELDDDWKNLLNDHRFIEKFVKRKIPEEKEQESEINDDDIISQLPMEEEEIIIPEKPKKKRKLQKKSL